MHKIGRGQLVFQSIEHAKRHIFEATQSRHCFANSLSALINTNHPRKTKVSEFLLQIVCIATAYV